MCRENNRACETEESRPRAADRVVFAGYQGLTASGFSVSGLRLDEVSKHETVNARQQTRLVAQFFDLTFVHAEIMGDFVEHGKTDLRAQFFEIGKIFAQRLGEYRDFVREQRRVQSRWLRQRHALINSEQSIAPRMQPFG